jgi:hypothetical protein
VKHFAIYKIFHNSCFTFALASYVGEKRKQPTPSPGPLPGLSAPGSFLYPWPPPPGRWVLTCLHGLLIHLSLSFSLLWILHPLVPALHWGETLGRPGSPWVAEDPQRGGLWGSVLGKPMFFCAMGESCSLGRNKLAPEGLFSDQEEVQPC